MAAAPAAASSPSLSPEPIWPPLDMHQVAFEDSMSQDDYNRLKSLELRYRKVTLATYSWHRGQIYTGSGAEEILDERAAILGKIEGFWLKMIKACPHIAWLVHPDDEELLKKLYDVRLIDVNAQDARNYTISFTFAPNNYLMSETLNRKISVDPAVLEDDWIRHSLTAPTIATSIEIEWTGVNLVEKNPRVWEGATIQPGTPGAMGSFFAWFEEEEEHLGVAEAFVRMLEDPISLYVEANLRNVVNEKTGKEANDDAEVTAAVAAQAAAAAAAALAQEQADLAEDDPDDERVKEEWIEGDPAEELLESERDGEDWTEAMEDLSSDPGHGHGSGLDDGRMVGLSSNSESPEYDQDGQHPEVGQVGPRLFRNPSPPSQDVLMEDVPGH